MPRPSKASTVKLTTFVAGPGGAVVRYAPKLSANQALTAAEAAIQAVTVLCGGAGFENNAIVHAVDAVSFECRDFCFDLKIWPKENVAHVTSHAGYAYDSKKVTATVTHMASELAGMGVNCDHVIALNFSPKAHGSVHTLKPVFIPILQSKRQLSAWLVTNILLSLRDFISRLPRGKDLAATLDTKALLASNSPCLDVESGVAHDFKPTGKTRPGPGGRVREWKCTRCGKIDVWLDD